jgi:hypothetical protein
MAELRLGGVNPTLFHLTNVLLQALNTALVALLARHLGRDVGRDAILPYVGVGLRRPTGPRPTGVDSSSPRAYSPNPQRYSPNILPREDVFFRLVSYNKRMGP